MIDWFNKKYAKIKEYGQLYLNIFISEGTRKKHYSFFTSEKKPVLLFAIYRILGILFLGVTLSRGISGEPSQKQNV
jgi:hypothetical protein